MVLCDRSCCALILVDIPTQPLAGFLRSRPDEKLGFSDNFTSVGDIWSKKPGFWHGVETTCRLAIIEKIHPSLTMSTVIDIGTLIDRHPGIHGGCPIIAGTGVTVRRIVIWYQQGLTAEEIADEIGHLTLGQVYAALTYYHMNKNEIDADIAAEEAEADRIYALHKSGELL